MPQSILPASHPSNSPVWSVFKMGILSMGVIPLLALSTSLAQTPNFNYAEALQKALLFFDAEKSGPGVTGGRVEWRGDSELADTQVPLGNTIASNRTNMSVAFITANRAALDPDNDGLMDVSGGFHTAGDHVRFGLPQAYAASTLAWSLFEFRPAFEQSGQLSHLIEELHWFADCFLRSTFRDSLGNVIAFCYQAGSGFSDHAYWGPPELQMTMRTYRFATSENPASDIVAGHAAALAAIGVTLQTTDAVYAARCIEAARALYRFAVSCRGLSPPDGFYNSYNDEDDLSWAAVWLYQATGNSQYLADIESVTAGGEYSGYLKAILARPADTYRNIWVHSWEQIWGGVFIRLAAMTGNSRYLAHAQWNANYWMGLATDLAPTDYNPLFSSGSGFKSFGIFSATQHNCAAQLCALVLRKYTGQTALSNWAVGQMNYIMGNNPQKISYIVGFPNFASSAQHPHDRAAQGGTHILDPVFRHILWGALVSGSSTDGDFSDDTADYIKTEVGVTFNSSLVGALAGLYTYFGAGQKPLINFPRPETVVEPPYYVEAKIVQDTTIQTTVRVRAHAIQTHPPKFERGLSLRYFFDVSELAAARQSIDDVKASLSFPVDLPSTQNNPVIRGPISWDGGSVYYVELDWSGQEIYGARESQFIIKTGLDALSRGNWKSHNDWSRQGLTTVYATRPSIAVYRDGVLAFGVEPPTTLTPNFSIWTNPGTRNLAPGSSTTVTVNLLRTHGFSGTVLLIANDLPPGMTASFSSKTTTGDSVTLTLSAFSTTTLGKVAITVIGLSGPNRRSTTLDLNIGGSE